MCSTMHDNDPEVLDREKRRSLARHGYQTSSPIDHAPGWNEHLASSSEAYVKADQDLSNPAELAKRTAAHMTAKHSSEERMESSSASYDRDEVGGPLKSAAGMHGEVDEYEEELSDHDNQWHHRVVKERTVIEDVKKVSSGVTGRRFILTRASDLQD
ncbi:hypothetical protein FA95DRAFT_1501821 [Auriscalpium vulgare]|uniref:Uncharacterized protein n=1 Tax=Auriscalpium vulgare TaxID=40419 RepID=A0ACB8RAR2_9AGAM|nr:hypothetical protein FA95DRAFT_1501821 [Auriscalpium vulgare]